MDPGPMSRASGPGAVVEQRNLFGGVDVCAVYGRTRINASESSDEGASGWANLVEQVEAGDTPAADAIAACPRCGHVGPTEEDFGFRRRAGHPFPQSWCRRCRSRGGR